MQSLQPRGRFLQNRNVKILIICTVIVFFKHSNIGLHYYFKMVANKTNIVVRVESR